MLLLIRASLTAQEQDRVHESFGGSGKRVLIIGGSGKMGGWLARFLASQSFVVEVADPKRPDGEFAHISDWESSPLDHDLIIVATPLRSSCGVLEALACGVPALVSFRAGAAELVADGKTGRVLDDRAAGAAWAAAALPFLAPARREEAGRRARADALRHPWSHHVARVLEVYRELAGGS